MPDSRAEREGFEPSDPVTQVNSLAVSPIRPLSHLSSRTFAFRPGPLVHNLSIIATPKSVKGSLRERSPGVWQVRVSLGRDPATHRYRYAAATVRGTKTDA